MARTDKTVIGAQVAMYPPEGEASGPLRGRHAREFLPAKQELFFEALVRSFNVRQSAREAGVSTSTIHRWCKHNDAFRARFDEALDAGFTEIRTRMMGIAIEGVRRRSIVRRIDERTIETEAITESPAHMMNLIRLRQEELARIDAEARAIAAAGAAPDETRLSAWLRADLDAIEADMRRAQDGAEDGEAGDDC